MTELTWHLERAKIVLEEWYLSADYYLRQQNFFLNLVVPSSKYAGIVWYDRYKMVLDCQRGIFK